MKGKHKIVVSTKRLKYEFELHRNLTIIRGDSATGKTTLKEMNLSKQKSSRELFRKQIIIM